MGDARKVVQLVVVPGQPDETDTIVVLADDGTMWVSLLTLSTTLQWKHLENIPA